MGIRHCRRELAEARGWFNADVKKGEEGNETTVVLGGLTEDNCRLGDVWIMKFD
jgi:hypothetical protein